MEQLRNQLHHLAESGRRLCHVHGREDLHQVSFELLQKVFGCIRLAIFMKDKEDGELSALATSGCDEVTVERVHLDSRQLEVARFVFESGRSELVAETLGLPLSTPIPLSEMATPLWDGGGKAGVLYVSSELRPFTDNDLAILDTIGNQVSLSIQNIQLTHGADERSRRMVTISKAGNAVASEHNMAVLLPHILKSLSSVLNSKACAIQLWDEDHENLIVTAALGYEKEWVGTKIPWNKGVNSMAATRNALKGRPSIIPDLEKDSSTVDRHQITNERWRSELAVPITYRNEVIGVMSAAHHQAEHFRETDLLLASVFADQSAVAIGTSQAHTYLNDRNELLEKHLTAISELATTIASRRMEADIRGMLTDMLQIAKNTLGAQTLSLLLPAGENICLEIQVLVGDPRLEPSRRMIIEKTAVGEAFRAGCSILVPDVEADPRYAPVIGGKRSEIAVPLQMDNDTYGCLDAKSNFDVQMTIEDLHFLELVAAQVTTLLLPTLRP